MCNVIPLTGDYCLGHFLRGYVQSSARYQPSSATPAARVVGDDEKIDHGAEADFQAVIRHGPDVEVSERVGPGLSLQLDHYILYHCHYELGRLYARRGDKIKARYNFDVVMHGEAAWCNSR